MQTCCMNTPNVHYRKSATSNRSSNTAPAKNTPSTTEPSTPPISEKERKRIVEELIKEYDQEEIKHEKNRKRDKKTISSSSSKSSTSRQESPAGTESTSTTSSTKSDDTETEIVDDNMNDFQDQVLITSSDNSSIGSVSSEPIPPINPESIFDTSPDYWNSFWGQNGDGSRVLSIDKSKMQVIIEDASRKEKLIVDVNKKPYRKPAEVEDLKYDERINKRINEDRQEGERNHDFATMLDYVIQCTGKMGSYTKDINSPSKDKITLNVTRVNTETNARTRCIAEYTFYKDPKGNNYLYHRLLRPINQQAPINLGNVMLPQKSISLGEVAAA